MRRVVPFVLVLAACTGMAEDTTTTPPPARSSTTTAAPSTTTTTEPKTPIANVEDCVDRDGDGVLRSRRGFVCPPTMGNLRLTEDGVIYNRPGDRYLAGTYATVRFRPAFAFSRTEPFSSGGERSQIVELDATAIRRFFQAAAGRVQSVLAFGGPIATDIADMTKHMPINWEEGSAWATDVVVTSTSLDGLPTEMTTFVAKCPDDPGGVSRCDIPIPGLDWWWFRDGERVTMVTTEIDDTPFLVLAATEQETFDTYWTNTVQPILDSIEFLEP